MTCQLDLNLLGSVLVVGQYSENLKSDEGVLSVGFAFAIVVEKV